MTVATHIARWAPLFAAVSGCAAGSEEPTVVLEMEGLASKADGDVISYRVLETDEHSEFVLVGEDSQGQPVASMHVRFDRDLVHLSITQPDVASVTLDLEQQEVLFAEGEIGPGAQQLLMLVQADFQAFLDQTDFRLHECSTLAGVATATVGICALLTPASVWAGIPGWIVGGGCLGFTGFVALTAYTEGCTP